MPTAREIQCFDAIPWFVCDINTANAKIITERRQVSETKPRAEGYIQCWTHVTMQSLSNIIQAYFEIFQPNTCPIVSNV